MKSGFRGSILAAKRAALAYLRSRLRARRTSQLSIAFDPELWAGYAVAAADAIDGDGVRRWQGSLTIGETKTIDIERGRYVIRARLPSGMEALALVRVDRGPATATLRLSRGLPSESFGPAFYTNRIRPGRLAVPLAPEDVAIWTRDPADSHWSIGAPLERPLTTHPGVAVYVEKFDAFAQNGIVADLSVTPDPSHPDVTVFLRVRNRFAAIPTGSPARVLLIGDAAGEPRTIVGSQNGAADGLLSYMNDGDYASSRLAAPEFIERAGSLLYAKRADPTAAAIGGYYLALCAPIEEIDSGPWEQWGRNLASWFPWLADGAVIAGWNAYRKGQTAAARAHLLEACARGVPVYTIGLRILADGTRILATMDRSDEEVAIAADWAAERARRADWTALTTVLEGDRSEGDGMLLGGLRPVWTPVGAGA